MRIAAIDGCAVRQVFARVVTVRTHRRGKTTRVPVLAGDVLGEPVGRFEATAAPTWKCKYHRSNVPISANRATPARMGSIYL